MRVSRIIAALVVYTLAILPCIATVTHATTVPNCTAAQQGIPRPCGMLTAITALSGTDIWAVGTNTNVGTTGVLGSLIEHWDGRTWKSVPAPTAVGSTLRAVAAVSPSDVWAVGSGVIIHYDGRRWSITHTQQHFDLHAVVAISHNNLWAVGTGSSRNVAVAQIVHWDGAQWHQVKIPTIPNSSLLEVAAVSAQDVWAVGEFAPNVMKPLLLHWNGINWRTVAFPPGHYPTGQASPQSMVPSELTAVTVISGNNVWAVGSYNAADCCLAGTGPIAAQWNGTQWRQTKVPNVPNSVIANFQGVNLAGISAVSATDIWAVSNSDVAHWDGKQWKITKNPLGPQSTIVSFSAVAAISKQSVWAVGTSSNETIIAHWNGTRWSIAPSPNTNG